MEHGVGSLSSAELWERFDRAARRARWFRAAVTVGVVIASVALVVLYAALLDGALEGPTWARSLRPR